MTELQMFNDSLGYVRRRSSLFVGEGPVESEDLARVFAFHLLVLDCSEVVIKKGAGGCIAVGSPQDWIPNDPCDELARSYFERFVAMGPRIPNGCHFEIVLRALSDWCAMYKSGKCILTFGDRDPNVDGWIGSAMPFERVVVFKAAKAVDAPQDIVS